MLCCFLTFHFFCNETTAELNVRSPAFWSFPWHRWSILLVFINCFSQLLLLHWLWRCGKQGPQELCDATAQLIENLSCWAVSYQYLIVHKCSCRKGNAENQQRHWDSCNPSELYGQPLVPAQSLLRKIQWPLLVDHSSRRRKSGFGIP